MILKIIGYTISLLIVIELFLILFRTARAFVRKHDLLMPISVFLKYTLPAHRNRKIILRAFKLLLPIMKKGNFSGIIINSDKSAAIKLPNGCGFFWEPGDPGSLLGLSTIGDFEPFETNIVSKIMALPNIRIIFDVGANFGWFTVHMGAMSSDNSIVHSFEPAPEALKELKKNILLNRLNKKIILNEVCLSDRPGSAKLFIPEKIGTAFASLREQEYNQKFNEVIVPVDTIDNYCRNNSINHIDFIKIDVEGAEYLVFKGGEIVLNATKKPVMLVEISEQLTRKFGYSGKDLFRHLSSFGYCFYQLQKDRLAPLKEFESRGGYNFLCLIPDQHIEVLKML